MTIRTPLVALFLTALLLGGCRTYGGYGTEAELREQIQEAVRLFAADLERARGERDVLVRAAVDRTTLVPLATRYEALVEAHEVVLEEQRDLAAALAEENDYRQLKSGLGAIVVVQETVRLRYRDLVDDVTADVAAQVASGGYDDQSRYSAVPPYYVRLRNDRSASTLASILERPRPSGADSSGAQP